MEHRVSRFYELHNNKWFHIMNVCIEIIQIKDKSQKIMLTKYGHHFFYLYNVNQRNIIKNGFLDF